MQGYHSKTFALLGQSPHPSPAAAAEVTAVESRIGRPLPRSLKEWYSLEGACALLLHYSNADPPVPVMKLGLDDTGRPCEVLRQRNLLIIRHENQGVCSWAVDLTGGDDPPVLVTYRQGFADAVQVSPRFSEYVYLGAWDWKLTLRRPHMVQAQNQPLSDAAEQHLTSSWTAVPESRGWPGDRQLRFSRGSQHILIWCSDGQADWHLTDESEDGLTDLIRSVGHLDNLRAHLWAHNDAGKRALHRAAQ